MLSFIVLLVLAAFANARVFDNPVTARALVYPSPVKYLDTYYLIDEFKINSTYTFPLLVSKDLQNFNNFSVQIQARKADVNVVVQKPELHVIQDGQFVMYFQRDATYSGTVISTAYASNIEGPYYVNEKPVLESNGDDFAFPTLLNSHGVLYLIYGHRSGMNYGIYGQRLLPDGLGVADEPPKFLLNATLPWEGNQLTSPSVLLRGDYYYLFYSTSQYCDNSSGIGVARSYFPLGPYEKLGNPIVTNDLKLTFPTNPQLVKDIDDKTDIMVHGCYKSTDNCESSSTAKYACARSLTWGSDNWPAIEK